MVEDETMVGIELQTDDTIPQDLLPPQNRINLFSLKSYDNLKMCIYKIEATNSWVLRNVDYNIHLFYKVKTQNFNQPEIFTDVETCKTSWITLS